MWPDSLGSSGLLLVNRSLEELRRFSYMQSRIPRLDALFDESFPHGDQLGAAPIVERSMYTERHAVQPASTPATRSCQRSNYCVASTITAVP
jgi:hypothetical protein